MMRLRLCSFESCGTVEAALNLCATEDNLTPYPLTWFLAEDPPKVLVAVFRACRAVAILKFKDSGEIDFIHRMHKMKN